MSQVLWFDYLPAKTLTGKLFAVGSDTQTDSTTAAVEETNRSGKYSVTFTGISTGLYEMRIYESGSCIGYVPYNITAATGNYYELTAIEALLTNLPQSYRDANAEGSVAEILYEVSGHVGRSAIVGTTKTVYELDGTTPAKTFALNHATTPSAVEEST